MINASTTDILKQMRCTAMAEEFERQLKDSLKTAIHTAVSDLRNALV